MADNSSKIKLMPLFVGTYTDNGKSKGIYRLFFNPETGVLSDRCLVAETENPSFLAIEDSKKKLVCVNEVSSYGDDPTGAISSFEISPDHGLQFIFQLPSEGRAPCHLSFSTNRVFVSNYLDGSIVMFRIEANGTLNKLAVQKHTGKGPNRIRQQEAHAHSITPLPGGKFVVAADLGCDQLIVYDINEDTFKRHFSIKESAGSGPRHLALSPCGSKLFLLNELNSTLSLYNLEPDSGSLEKVCSVSTLASNWQGENITAELKVSEDGRFIYCSNRGDDSIAVIKYNLKDDLLKCIQIIKSGGKHPRNFTLTPDGRFLLCANQNSDNIVTFAIDPQSGLLAETKFKVQVPTPTCLCWGNDKQALKKY